MNYKMPTLGGLKKLQEFFATNGFPLPTFQTNIYDGQRLSGIYLCTPATPPEDARTVSLDDELVQFGPLHEINDIRLLGENGRGIQFSDTAHFFAAATTEIIHAAGWGCHLSIMGTTKNDDWEFEDFINSLSNEDIMSIAHFGKRKPSIRDKFLLYISPIRYAQKTFA